jgi:hypothetical protein
MFMCSTYLQSVIELSRVADPIEAPSADDWTKAEAELQVVLPWDYKALLSAVGSGRFGEVAFLNPKSSSPYLILTRQQLLGFCDRVGATASNAGLSLYPDETGAVWIGTSPNGMELLFRPHTNDEYGLYLLERDYDSYRTVDTTITQFLYQLYNGLRSETWTAEMRDLVWEPHEKFFTPRPEEVRKLSL